MANLYFGLHRYLYAVFIVLAVSHPALAVTPQEQAYGGFAEAVICSHPTQLDYCVPMVNPEAAPAACGLWQKNLDPKFSYRFSAAPTASNGVQYCLWTGTNPANNLPAQITQNLTKKAGLCPALDAPPPSAVVFSRNGRWWPQELPSKRCYRNCEYQNGQAFDFKHYQYTNGIVTQFTELSGNNRLKSTASFCEMEVEPSKDSTGEVTYESDCDDAVFAQFCDFINWFRNDSEMPEAPPVADQNLNIPTYLRTDILHIDLPENTTCFKDYQFVLQLPFLNKTVEQDISFQPLCTQLETFSNVLRALYLLHACMIIFRK